MERLDELDADINETVRTRVTGAEVYGFATLKGSTFAP